MVIYGPATVQCSVGLPQSWVLTKPCTVSNIVFGLKISDFNDDSCCLELVNIFWLQVTKDSNSLLQKNPNLEAKQ